MNIFWVHACVHGLKATNTPLGCCVCMPVPLYTFMFLKPAYKVSIPRSHRPPRTKARVVHVLVDRGFEERENGGSPFHLPFLRMVHAFWV